MTPVTVTSPAQSPDLLDETLQAASGLIGERLEVVGDAFPGSRRTLVLRVRSAVRSLVVKRYLGAEGREAYAREASALTALAGFAGTPGLVAESSTPRLVVMDDLGDGTHLADALLGPDADLASTTLSGWAAALAGLHTAGRDTREAFEAGVLARAAGEPESRVEIDYLPGQLATAAT